MLLTQNHRFLRIPDTICSIRALMPTSQLADIVFDGIREERLYILTHELDELINQRAKAINEGGSHEPITSFEQFE